MATSDIPNDIFQQVLIDSIDEREMLLLLIFQAGQ